jgi:predicted transcriptional regulator of viral defense system
MRKEDKLYMIAERQQGYFTAAQAVACGYPTSGHAYHLKAGTWRREHRGIYRLVRFPMSDDAQYVLWSLWSRNRQGVPQGVYSHQTALALFELSDLMPRRLHLTVPPDFRRSTPIPDILVLYRGHLAPEEYEERQGFRVTRPLKTVADLLAEASVSKEHLRQALEQGLDSGLITRTELEQHPQYAELKHLIAGRRQ